MSQQDNTQIVKQAYENFKKGDIPALLGQLKDDATWELPKVDNVPFSGKRQGRDQVGQFFSSLAENQEVLNFEPQEFVAQDDKVVVLGHYAWSVKNTDRVFESDWVHVFTVRDGQVAAFREFGDTALAAEAYRPR